jgi:putative transposase
VTEPDRPDLPTRKYKRCRRYNEPGHAHALTFSCFRRQPFLDRDRSRSWTIDAIDRARRAHGFHIWAYVLMPEHVHLLVWPSSSPYEIGPFLATLKSSVTRRALAFVRHDAPGFLPRMLDQQPSGKRSYRFWQRGGGYDRNIWEPQYVWSTIDYIHANPVRRGLCQRPQDWSASSAGSYLDCGAGPISIDRQSLPPDPRNDLS